MLALSYKLSMLRQIAGSLQSCRHQERSGAEYSDLAIQDPDSIAPEEEKEPGEIKKLEGSAAPTAAAPNQATAAPKQTLPKLEDILRPRVIRSPSASEATGDDSSNDITSDSAGASHRHRCRHMP